MNLEISAECGLWDKIDVRSISTECANAVFSELKLNGSNIEICILFSDDEEIQLLNKTYRGINKPTNILSFQNEQSFLDKEDELFAEQNILGSITIAFETTKNESLEQKKPFEHHLKHLVIHGILHLLGYDHIKSSEAKKMESIEIKILKKMNIKNPYE